MRNRENGASQIPLVICIVLLLIAGFFAYNQYSEREAVETRLNSIVATARAPEDASLPSDDKVKSLITFARTTGSQLKNRLEEVAAETGGREDENPDMVVSPAKLKATRNRLLDALDKGEFNIEFPVDRFIEAQDGGIKVQQGEGKITANYGGTKELRGANPDMVAVIDVVVVPAMRRMVADIKRYRDAYAAAVTAKETAEAQYRTSVSEKDKEIRQKMDDLAALESRKAQEITDLRRQLSEAEAARSASEEEKTRAVASLTTERNAARKDAEQKSAEVQVLKQRKRHIELDTSADGRVLTADETQSLVVIDLGKANNNLMAGTNFEVYAIGKGGREIPKGTIKVSKVDGRTSTCRVLELHDAYNPIIQGDQIRSLTYSPKEVIHVALVGRFSKMGKSDAARRLESLGVVVDDRVGLSTHFLVVGMPESDTQPIEESEEYKAAEMYGIPTIGENYLSRFTMY